ncbi:nucleotidyltransferase domain protein [archaeon]|nr:nucleotidyltransferase domain protein [archaeon]
MDVKEDLAWNFLFLKGRKDILAVLLFSSYARREATSRSDIDICVVAPKADKQSLLSLIF